MLSSLPLLSAKFRKLALGFYGLRLAKRSAALTLALHLLLLPTQVSAVVVRDAIKNSSVVATGLRDRFVSWLMQSPPQVPEARGVKSPPPEQKLDKLNRLTRLQINPKGAVQLRSRERIFFTAMPFDSEGSAIHGLQAEWESSDKQVVFIKRDGQALAGKPGTATVTARAGSQTASVQVIVMQGDGEPFGKKKVDSIRRGLRISQYPNLKNDASRIAARARKLHHSAKKPILSSTLPYMFLRDPNDDPLPDNETISLYKPINTVGSPPGRTRTVV